MTMQLQPYITGTGKVTFLTIGNNEYVRFSFNCWYKFDDEENLIAIDKCKGLEAKFKAVRNQRQE